MVKCLHLGCWEKMSHSCSNNVFPDDAPIHLKFLQGMHNNFHLQDLDLIFSKLQNNNHDDWEKSHILLHLYGEWNYSFRTLWTIHSSSVSVAIHVTHGRSCWTWFHVSIQQQSAILVASSNFQCMFSSTGKWNGKSEFLPDFFQFWFFGILVASLGYQKTEHFLLENWKKVPLVLRKNI